MVKNGENQRKGGTGPSGNLILILFGRFENAAFHMPFSSENPFLKISSSHFLAPL